MCNSVHIQQLRSFHKEGDLTLFCIDKVKISVIFLGKKATFHCKAHAKRESKPSFTLLSRDLCSSINVEYVSALFHFCTN